MDLLKRRIIEDGTELGTEVVKVDSFLNHQLDIFAENQLTNSYTPALLFQTEGVLYLQDYQSC